jgi:hypothetical protein
MQSVYSGAGWACNKNPISVRRGVKMSSHAELDSASALKNNGFETILMEFDEIYLPLKADTNKIRLLRRSRQLGSFSQ